jgi:hypothetical protein
VRHLFSSNWFYIQPHSTSQIIQVKRIPNPKISAGKPYYCLFLPTYGALAQSVPALVLALISYVMRLEIPKSMKTGVS